MSSDVIRVLGATKSWVRFIAILGFLVTALILISAIVMFVMTRSASGFSLLAPGVLGGIYLVMGVIYFVAAFKLNQYASRINDMLHQPSQVNLVAALDAQRGFWKYLGILAILVIAFYLVMMIGLVS